MTAGTYGFPDPVLFINSRYEQPRMQAESRTYAKNSQKKRDVIIEAISTRIFAMESTKGTIQFSTSSTGVEQFNT